MKKIINEELSGQVKSESINNDFSKLKIKQEILQIIEKEGFTSPTTVQNRAIPFALAGDDVIVTSATGSGKTLVYAVNLIQKIEGLKQKGIKGVVLVPTRELAIQVGAVLKKFSENKPVNILVSYGGGSLKAQKNKLVETDILVGTPGRISDYIEQNLFELGHIEILVLDEVDSIMQQQFLDELNFILKTMPKNKQTLVFSATINREMYKIVKTYLNSSIRINIDKKISPKKLKQVYYNVEPNQKLSLLSHLLINERAGLILIFANRQDTAEFLAKNLKHTNLIAKVIHGDLSQGKRNRIIADFRAEKFDVLISTDMAARGIDIDNITHIYNYNIPKFDEKYIHRIGRTARAGNSGKIINFVSKADEKAFLDISRIHKINFIKKIIDFNLKEIKIKKVFKQKKHRR